VSDGLYSAELDPTSFDDLPLGGEWTTRRRTISESEIALFAALAGDFSPLSVDTSGGNTRLAPPALLVAMAVGLGSIDMPIPQIAAWEWVNWKFPKAVKAGETIYARWTLTQKRPPVHGAPAAIAVWRVDVHTAADGAVCAEGEIGASVFRRSAPHVERAAEPTAPGAPARRRRGRRRPAPAEPAAAAPAAPAPATPERTGSTRRRRRRRPAGSSSNGDSTPAGPAAETGPAAPAPALSPPPASPAPAGALSRVIRRLRRP
jgi:acyl dehydratase